MTYEPFLSVFAWRDGGGLPGIVEAYLRRVTATLTAQSLYSSAERHAELVGGLSALSPEGFLRVVRAPELFQALVARGSSPDGVVEQLLDDSIFVESGRGAPAGRRWSALGDAYRDPGGERTVSVAHGLPFAIDHDSPQIDVVLKVGDYRNHRFAASPHYDAAEATAITAAVEAAFALIRARAPVAAQLVAQAIVLVQLRRDDANPEFFTSASCNTHVGRAILINPHLRRNDVASLANALVHEAIHAILYMFEQDAPLLPRIDPKAPGYLVRSAWTGNALHLHTYLHAGFVWFGLFHFWTIALRDQPRRGGHAHLERARAGFLRPEVLDNPASYRDELAGGLWAILEAMVHQVRALSAGDALSASA
jgi:hypothetical protein